MIMQDQSVDSPGQLNAGLLVTCRQAGHFLASHDDLVAEDGPRRFAYVVNMTKDWDAKTEFFNDKGDVVESFVPHVNTVTVFSVPQPHVVTFVPPICPGRRVTKTTWFFHSEEAGKTQ